MKKPGIGNAHTLESWNSHDSAAGGGVPGMRPADAGERERELRRVFQIREWANLVWATWSAHHGGVADVVGKHLDFD